MQKSFSKSLWSKRVKSDFAFLKTHIYRDGISFVFFIQYPRPACVSSSCWDLVQRLRAIYIGIGGSKLFIARHKWKEMQGGRNGVGIRILSVGSDFITFQLTALLFVMSLHFPGVMSASCFGFVIPSSVPWIFVFRFYFSVRLFSLSISLQFPS